MARDDDSNVIDLDSRRPKPVDREDTLLGLVGQLIADHATPMDQDLERRVSALEEYLKKPMCS